MWHVKRDFFSLFESQKYSAIDGIRSISCLMIITVHIINFLNSFIKPYPSPEWMIYLKSYSFQLSALLSLALETFFMLSGFLLTLKCTEDNYYYTWKGYFMYIVQRMCRFWPGILMITIVMIVFGDPQDQWISFWLFYQNYVDIKHWSVGMASLWSISLDMQMHILLPIILYMITTPVKNHQRTYAKLYFLIMLSILYSLLVFNPETMNLSMIVYRHNSMAILISPRMFDWISSEYNVTLAFQRPIEPSPIASYMKMIYLPLLGRYSSFLIGSILALNLINAKNSNTIYYGKLKKHLYLTITSLYMIVLTIQVESDSTNPALFTIMVSIIRPFFAMGVAFIIFSAICPSSHPYYNSRIRSFLSLPIWTPISKLSYLIYVLHFRIAFELIMSSAHLFESMRSSIDILTCIFLLITLTICMALAVVWYIIVEKPFERFIQRILSEKKKTHRE